MNYGIGKIVSIVGRYYAMDRDNRYERTKLAYDMLVSGIGTNVKTVQKSVESSYEAEEFDEFVKPICILDDNDKVTTISDNDSVIFFNFRPDRARQITKALTSNDFNDFTRSKVLKNLVFVTMTCYDKNLSVDVAYRKDNIQNTIGEYISNLGYSQLRIAETEKYAHVTFFLNGGQETKYTNESRILIPSPKVATYDLMPEMSANEITDNVIDAIDSKDYDLIIMNYANGDMVGHTGNLDKTIEAIEVLDKCVGRVISKLDDISGEGIITADHGNSEYMIDFKTGEAITSHSNFDVPLIVISNRVKSIENGRLCDIAPTLLNLMNLKKPKEMTGNSLIEIV
ncbi:MAG: 2,3-bisphosphoglycerate-independent phosphoglycerate mutase [Clostridia bacterium]